MSRMPVFVPSSFGRLRDFSVRLAFAVLVGGGWGMACGAALADTRAANSLPAFAFPPDDTRERAARENWTFKPVPIPQPKESYLGTVLQLQDQIELIKKLSERQDALGKLRKTYGSLGIPFTMPPPPRSVCEKIPPSLVCVQAYPDLLKIAMPEPGPESTSDVPKPVVAAAPKAPPDEAQIDYRWTDVTCAGGACRAVLVEADNPHARRTVSEGETLPGGVVVSRIAFEGVRVHAGGEDRALSPAVAPSRGGSSSPLFAASKSQTSPAARKRTPAEAVSGDKVSSDEGASKEPYQSEAKAILKAVAEKSPGQDKNR